MTKPFFSIIVPIYNVSKEYFECCINSLLKQSMRDIEIILVDDGSVLDCAKMCDEFADIDKRIKVIHQINKGVSAARNIGIETACADWIMFVDADDWLELDACEILKDELQGKSYDLLMFKCVREGSESCVLQYGLECGKLYDLKVAKEREFLYRRLVAVPPAQTSPIYYSWDKVYRRDLFLKNKLTYPLGLAKSEDKVFISLCLEKASTFYQIDKVLYHYRMNDASVCHRYSANMDTQRVMLTKTLTPIVKRMNQELAEKLGDPSCCRLWQDYERYLFGVVTEVLYLKFYHRDNPNKKGRRKEALKFLRTEPFYTVIRQMPYSTLSTAAKIKKFLLQHGFVIMFYLMHRYLLRFSKSARKVTNSNAV